MHRHILRVSGLSFVMACSAPSGTGSLPPASTPVCAPSSSITYDGGAMRSWQEWPSQSCAAGSLVSLGCSANCSLGSCTGDPVLRVCDGTSSGEQCAAGTGRVIENDDASCGGLCPAAAFTCPPSGRLTILVRAFNTQPFTCCLSQRAGALPPRDSGSSPTDGGSTPTCTLSCRGGNVSYSCGSGSTNTSYSYCSNGNRSGATLRFSNGNTVTCTLNCSGSGGSCRASTGQSCSF